jgi:UDP-GlcNAc:undecaprenyl-phosphate GlcNAc-1-phosphate transferase
VIAGLTPQVLVRLPSNVRYGLFFLVPFIVALVLTPWLVRLARRVGVLDQPGARKLHVEPTPYLGGLAVVAASCAAGLAPGGTSLQVITIVGCGVAIAMLGLLDDWRSQGPLLKVSVETVAACDLWLAGIRGGVFGAPWADLLVTIVWVVAITNAMNLLDNADGAATGVAAISALGLFVIAAVQGDLLIAALAVAVAGGCLGFLRYNFPPAKIFLGDGGSLVLGFLLAAIGLELDLVGPSGVVRGAIAVLAIGVPIFDLLLVVSSRSLAGRPVHVGGTDHVAHRLSKRGFSPTSVALTLMAGQVVCSVVALALFRAPVIIVVGGSLAMLLVAIGAIVVFLRAEFLRPRAVELGTGARPHARPAG